MMILFLKPQKPPQSRHPSTFQPHFLNSQTTRLITQENFIYNFKLVFGTSTLILLSLITKIAVEMKNHTFVTKCKYEFKNASNPCIITKRRELFCAIIPF